MTRNGTKPLILITYWTSLVFAAIWRLLVKRSAVMKLTEITLRTYEPLVLQLVLKLLQKYILVIRFCLLRSYTVTNLFRVTFMLCKKHPPNA